MKRAMNAVGVYLTILICLILLGVLWIKRKIWFREPEEKEPNEFLKE